MSPLPHWARSACVTVKCELLSRFFCPCFFVSIPLPVSLRRVAPLSWRWLVAAREYSHVLENPAVRSTRIVSPCNWLSFPPPNCDSLFIWPAFSTSAAPVLTVLLSNWQPTLSLKYKKKCFITMGPAKPLIMHGNMLVKKERIYFCGKCCSGDIWGRTQQIFTLQGCFLLKSPQFKALDSLSHEDFFLFISI